MKGLFTISVVLVTFTTGVLSAQTDSVEKKLDIYVFPSKNQNADTQKKDEADCYTWAVKSSGVDPINPVTAVGAPVDTSADGTAVVGAAKGAAAGAAIGAIAGDTGKGAGIGAVVGGIRGRRAKKHGDAKQQEANNNAATAQNKANTDSFKKAYSACLEAKGYSVKY